MAVETLDPPKNTSRPTLETRLAFERDYIKGKGTVEAIAERLSVSARTAWDWYFHSGLKERRLAHVEKVRQAISPPEPEPQQIVIPLQVNSNAKLQIVEEEIERLNKQLKTDLKPQVRAALVKSLDTMLEYVLPKSARTRKPSSGKSRLTDQPEPVPAQPVPLALSSVVQPTTSSVPVQPSTVPTPQDSQEPKP